MLGRREVLIAGAGVLAAPSIVRAEGENGVALVIGNSKYRWEASLPNVRRDVADVARAFQALGLRTELVQDVDAEAMRAAVEKFGASAKGAEFAVFYFAGHGAFRDKNTHIVPADADLSDPATARGLISSKTLVQAMKGARHRLVVFDACRNNPADGWRQRNTLLEATVLLTSQPSSLPPNTLVFYSTAPGRVALDGPPGENSVFAAALLRQLAAAPVDLPNLHAKMRREVLIATEGRQFVWALRNFSQPLALGQAGAIIRTSAAPTIDPARIVRLDKAYDYMHVNKGRVLLSDGLLAIRPAAGQPHADKIGSFQFDGREGVPSLFVVVSVNGDIANVVYASKFSLGKYGWGLFDGKLSGSDVTLAKTASVENADFDLTLHWRDAHSGSLRLAAAPAFNTRFTRLDG